MGYRLSKIYTRTGDQGTTGLADGRRVAKDHARIDAIGELDELNTLIGLLIAQGVPDTDAAILSGIQHRLFDLGGELAMPEHPRLTEQHTSELESSLDRLNETLPPLQEFILPGGGLPAASCHHARAVCRRVERRILHLSQMEGEEVNASALKYLNRLSDLLFVMARCLARQDGGEEIYWTNQK